MDRRTGMGRGSPNPAVNHPYNLRSRGIFADEQDDLEWAVGGDLPSSSNAQNIAERQGERAPSIVSRRSSNHSQSGQRRVEAVEVDTQEKMDYFDQTEADLQQAKQFLEVKVESMKSRISMLQEQLNNSTSAQMEEQSQQALNQAFINLDQLHEEQQLLNIKMNNLVKGNARKRELLLKKTQLQKNIIADDWDQYSGSDGEESQRPSVPCSAFDRPDIQRYIDENAESQRKKLEEDAMNAERDSIVKKFEDQVKIAKQALENAEKVAADAAEARRKLEEEMRQFAVKSRDSTPLLSNLAPPPQSSSSEIGQLTMAITQAIREVGNSRTPNVENNQFFARYSDKGLPDFYGKAEHWPYFQACFDISTREGGLSNATNIGRLGKSLKGEAREHVKEMLLSPDNVPEVMSSLKKRFGQSKNIIRAMIEKAKGVPNVDVNNVDTLIKFGAAVRNFTATIRTLQCPEYLTNPDLLEELETKLPDSLVREWLKWVRRDLTRSRKLESFTDWIKEESDLACEMRPFTEEKEKLPNNNQDLKSKDKRGNFENRKKFEEQIPTAAGLFVAEKDKCIFCGLHSNSTANNCAKARCMLLADKIRIVRDKKCCHLCLNFNHFAKNCKAYVSCLLCSHKHQTIMCPDLKVKVDTKTSTPTPDEPVTKNSTPILDEPVQITSTNLSCTSKVILKTIMVQLTGRNGTKSVRALIDDGSQRSYILKSLVEELGLTPTGTEGIAHQLFSGVHTPVKQYRRFQIQLTNIHGKGRHDISVLDQDTICGDIPRPVHGQWLQKLKSKKIWIEDIGEGCPEIEILIGADGIVGLTTGQEVLLDNGLMAVNTVLGWTLIGQAKQQEKCLAMSVTSLLSVEASVQQLWDLETIGIRDPSEQQSKAEKDEAVRQHFLSTVSRKDDGRYQVSLPWIDGKPNIPNNRKPAESRLENATKKLNVQGMFQNYGRIFEDWNTEGIIEEVVENDNKVGHFIPHRPVFKPESQTTPIRPVFDASFKTQRSPSLNDSLEKGPNLMELIPAIMMRFREKKIGGIADIRKAFQMIEVKEEDRDFLQFLWWKNIVEKEYRVYRHNRVVFGVNCSPYLLAAVLEFHLSNVVEEERDIAKKLLKSLYVDNCVTSEDTVEEFKMFQAWSTDVLAEAKMELRQWEFGFAENSGIDLSKCGLDFGGSGAVTSVLGYRWNKVLDTISCDFNCDELPCKLTKRTILSIAQRVYDPIGFTCPSTLQPKLLLQNLWNDKIGWDSEISGESKKKFEDWHKELPALLKISIPRNMTGFNSDRGTWQIHTFCDASQSAYAAVVFLRTHGEKGISLQLIQAKARVSPVKKITLNRLELMSCFIAATLTDSVKVGLSLSDIPTYFWTDSSTALAWIRRNDDWGTFVGNRVKTIITLTNSEDWRHVPGVLNPADLPSRGCAPDKLLESHWWEGPDWLRSSEKEWPSKDPKLVEEEIMLENKKSAIISTLLVKEIELPWYGCKSFFDCNVRNIAWLTRFVSYMKNTNRQSLRKGPLTNEEIQEAEINLMKMVQRDNFNLRDAVLSNIQVEMKEDGLVHVKHRLKYLEDSEEFRSPIILPHAHATVDQLIRKVHRNLKHAGTQIVLNKLREKYWVIRGRKAVRRVINNCFICKRFSATKSIVEPAPLPISRVRTGRVFEIIGVDLAGPLFLRGGDKAWIVLFTCSVYRCIHLELVKSLSTDAFMDSFSRFTARRGRPKTVYSDNGTNFVGAANAMKDLDWSKISQFYDMEEIKWVFNPPAAPWWGGWWERLIRSVKDLLRRSLGKSSLSYEKLLTLIVEVEAIINGRPLTTLTEDPEDFIPLTPAMFLHETPYPGISDRELLEPSGFQRALAKKKVVVEQIRMRFRKEYLALLVFRGKEQNCREFTVGDVVLISSENKKRWEWPIARILELYPGRDQHVRVAKLRTAQGILIRPIQRLYAMEISSPRDSAEIEVVVSNPAETEEEKVIQENNKIAVFTRAGRKVIVPDRLGL